MQCRPTSNVARSRLKLLLTQLGLCENVILVQAPDQPGQQWQVRLSSLDDRKEFSVSLAIAISLEGVPKPASMFSGIRQVDRIRSRARRVGEQRREGDQARLGRWEDVGRHDYLSRIDGLMDSCMLRSCEVIMRSTLHDIGQLVICQAEALPDNAVTCTST
jgi:hypothetical protein